MDEKIETNETAVQESPIGMQDVTVTDAVVSDETGVQTAEPVNPNLKWYIVQAFTNYEQVVAELIEAKARQEGVMELIDEIVVPKEKVIEVRKGKRYNVDRKLFPGYVLIHADLTPAVFQMIKGLDKVTGFLGNDRKAAPISDREAAVILNQIEEGRENPKPMFEFAVGDAVKVTTGAFATHNGIVETVDEKHQKVVVGLKVFGRSTPIEFSVDELEKNA